MGAWRNWCQLTDREYLKKKGLFMPTPLNFDRKELGDFPWTNTEGAEEDREDDYEM